MDNCSRTNPPWNFPQDSYPPNFCPPDNYPRKIPPGQILSDNCPHEITPRTIVPGLLPPGQLRLNNSPLDPLTISHHEVPSGTIIEKCFELSRFESELQFGD